MSVHGLSFDSFLSLFLEGQNLSIDEHRLRSSVKARVMAFLDSENFSSEEAIKHIRFSEFAISIEQSVGITIGENNKSLSENTYRRDLVQYTTLLGQAGGIRIPFILAIWYWFHKQKLSSYTKPIDNNVLGSPLSDVLKTCQNYADFGKFARSNFDEADSVGQIKQEAVEEDVVGFLREAAEAKPIFLPDPHNASQVHSYAYSGEDKIGVLGRKNEQEKLQRFLETEQNFLWLQVAGVAGQGKSRLGWELIQHAREKLLWQAGFWAIPTDLEATDDIDKFITFWDNWSPDKPHLLVIDYVVALGPVLGPAVESLIEHSDAFKHPVRLLLLERQRWDRGGFVVNHDQDEPDELKSSLTHSLNRSAWFDDLNEAATKRDLADPGYLYDKTGIVELTRLSSEDLVRITRDVISLTAERGEVLRSDADIEISLAKIDREGRPLYAYFLGQSIADESFKGSWTRDDLLKSVLNREQKKRWSVAFDGDPPALGSKEDTLSIAILATICGGVTQEQLINLPAGPKISDQFLGQSLALVNGPLERGVTGPAEVVPPLQPDILGEWFVLTAIKLQGKQARDKLIHQAWMLSPTGCTRFLERVATDFPNLVVQTKLFEILPKKNAGNELFNSERPQIFVYSKEYETYFKII